MENPYEDKSISGIKMEMEVKLSNITYHHEYIRKNIKDILEYFKEYHASCLDNIEHFMKELDEMSLDLKKRVKQSYKQRLLDAVNNMEE